MSMRERSYTEPTLRDIMSDVWRARYWIAGACIAVVVIAGAIALTGRAVYRAEMIVAPADGYALGDYASSNTYDRVASLPFWRPTDPEGISTDYYRFIYTLKGASVAEILLKDDVVIEGIRKDPGARAPGGVWSAEALSEYLERRLSVDQLGATPLRRLRYTHPDQAFAAAFLRKLHLVADQMIRRDRRRQSENRVTYLQGSLDSTAHPEHRKAIANLLIQQEHVRMLANLDEPYAAIVVEPAAASARPVWPNPPLLFASALAIGVFLGFSLWLIFARRNDGQ